MHLFFHACTLSGLPWVPACAILLSLLGLACCFFPPSFFLLCPFEASGAFWFCHFVFHFCFSICGVSRGALLLWLAAAADSKPSLCFLPSLGLFLVFPAPTRVSSHAHTDATPCQPPPCRPMNLFLLPAVAEVIQGCRVPRRGRLAEATENMSRERQSEVRRGAACTGEKAGGF